MNDTHFKEAHQLFEPEVQTYQSEQAAIRSNYERLKAARLARQNSPD